MTEAELLEALRAAQPAVDNGALTSEEIAEALGVSANTARRWLRPLLRSGKVDVVRKIIRSVDGRVQPVTAYRPAA